MATRFYFSSSTSAAVTPPAASGSDWLHINSTTALRKLLTADDSSALTNLTYTPDAGDDITDGDAMFRQFVSDALAAQTISGNFTAQLQGTEANLNNNLFLTFKILVVSNDGSTVKATLLAKTRDGSGTEFGNITTNRTYTSRALSSYTCSDGDRLVIEVGMGGLPTNTTGTQGHNGMLRFGTSAAGGDLPANNSDTNTNKRGWCEFSGTLTFQTPVVSQPGAAGLSTTMLSPSASLGYVAYPGCSSLNVSRLSPAVSIGYRAYPGLASLLTSGLAPTSLLAIVSTPGTRTLTLSAQAPNLVLSLFSKPGVASLSLVAAAPTVYNFPTSLLGNRPAISVHGRMCPATCWKIERTDGVVLRFTDHDNYLSLDGEQYSPAGAISTSARQWSEGLEVTNAEIRGAISSDSLLEEDLLAGRYRQAKITEKVVDWRFPWAQTHDWQVFYIEETNFDGEKWIAKLVGQRVRFQQKIGQVLTLGCRYNLGDANCSFNGGVDLSSLISTGTVTAVVAARRVFETDLLQSDDFFNIGKMTFTSGENDLLFGEVKRSFQGDGKIELQIAMPFDVSPGDTFEIHPGCDKTFATCKDVYGNQLNYGGYPNIPGQDKIFLYPDPKAII